MRSLIHSGALALSLLALACSSSDGEGGGDGGGGGNVVDDYETLKIATWFAAPGELEALQEVISDYQEEYVGARVEIVTVGIGPVARNAQYHEGDDTFDAVEWDVGYQMLPFLSHMTDVAVDLSTIDSLSGTLANADPALQGALEVGGMVPGLPLAIDRLNGLTYNLSSMTDPPGTLQEYRDVCQAYVDAGKTGPTPYTTGMRDVNEDTRIYLILLLGALPADVIFGQAADPEPALREALEMISFYRDNDCFHWISDDNQSGANWDEGAQAIIDNEAVMTVQTDWARGYFVANGKTPGVDYATRIPLDDVGAYVYTAEFLSANAASPKMQEIENFLGVAGRLSTQLSYSAIRGSLPGLAVPNPETDISDQGTLSARLEFEETQADGRLGTMAPWIASGTKPTNYMLPFMLGDMSLEDAIQGYLCGDGAPYPGYDCPQ